MLTPLTRALTPLLQIKRLPFFFCPPSSHYHPARLLHPFFIFLLSLSHSPFHRPCLFTFSTRYDQQRQPALTHRPGRPAFNFWHCLGGFGRTVAGELVWPFCSLPPQVNAAVIGNCWGLKPVFHWLINFRDNCVSLGLDQDEYDDGGRLSLGVSERCLRAKQIVPLLSGSFAHHDCRLVCARLRPARVPRPRGGGEAAR